MPAPRKPKKVFIQFAIALVVAVIFGVAALGVGFVVIQTVSKNAEQVKAEAQRQADELKRKTEEIERQKKKLDAAPRSYKVVKALVDLKPGQPITQDMVAAVEVLERPSPATLSTISSALGKVVRSPVVSGDPLESSKLLDTGGFINVEKGLRAITIQVDSIGGLNGAIMPGSHVDVLITLTQGEDGTVTKTLLQNVSVVSVGASAPGSSGPSNGGARLSDAKPSSGGAGGALAVTLVVTPKQAEALTLAGQVGGFHLAMRSFGDNQKTALAGSDITSLMTDLQPGSMSKALPMPPKMPSHNGFQNVNYSPGEELPAPSGTAAGGGPKFSMQIYRGTGSETVDFEQ